MTRPPTAGDLARGKRIRRRRDGDVAEMRLGRKFYYAQLLCSTLPYGDLAEVIQMPGHRRATLEAVAECLKAGNSYRVNLWWTWTMEEFWGVSIGRLPIPDLTGLAFRGFVVESSRNPDGWQIVEEPFNVIDAVEYAKLHPDIDQRQLPVKNRPSPGLFGVMLRGDWEPSMAKDRSLGLADWE